MTEENPNRKISLLLVDDEDDFRETAFTYFKKQGFRVEEAEDAEEAINLSTNRQFDVAVIDIHMPGMSGVDLLGHLLEEDPKPQGYHVDRWRHDRECRREHEKRRLRFSDQTSEAGPLASDHHQGR